MKTKRKEQSLLRSEREKRRRKFLTWWRTRQQGREKNKYEDMAERQLVRESITEKNLGHELWKVRQYKKIIGNNRDYRSAQYNNRRDRDHKEA